MAKSKTVTVYHPTFEDVSEEIDADRVDAWTDAGWRKTPLKNGDKVAGITDDETPSTTS